MLLDYDAWLPGLAVLGLAFLKLQPGQRGLFKALRLLGLAAGGLLVLWLSLPDLGSYVAVRQSQNAPHSVLEFASQAMGGFKGYWLGGPGFPASSPVSGTRRPFPSGPGPC